MLPNVLPDLAVAMKQNPDMKVMVNGGYFDVSTPYFEGKMEMRHLPVPPALRANVEYHYYQSGHMVYVHPPTLVAAARQCRATSSGGRAGCGRGAIASVCFRPKADFNCVSLLSKSLSLPDAQANGGRRITCRTLALLR